MRGWEDKLPASAPGASGAAGWVRAWGLLLTLEEALHWVSCCIAQGCSGVLKTVALFTCLLYARMVNAAGQDGRTRGRRRRRRDEGRHADTG